MHFQDQSKLVSKGITRTQPNVLVADDHLMVRDAIVSAISREGEFQVFVASTFENVIEQINENGPFLITLLDINMPGMDGIKSVASIVATTAAGAVVMISGNASQDIVRQGMAVGASGFISKSMKLGALVPALRLVATGEKFIATSAMGYVDGNWHAQSDSLSDKMGLSKSEHEILQLVAGGLQNKEVAWKSGHSEVKVKMHMRNICKKLGASNRTGAALKARELGLI
ncbi:MAG: response regulator transcription factor [Pseudotabrizicola sp.]|uniref:response regulator n=1 Tax=Pseudotabrizicola sp. TaxID=2939647 RepID=UPI002724023D|nr:response regulator transcription factor [Pseudotabrizicola sp.]MDO9640613.1 response regulator transcription factor [Pseudotabrizicola sp.]